MESILFFLLGCGAGIARDRAIPTIGRVPDASVLFVALFCGIGGFPGPAFLLVCGHLAAIAFQTIRPRPFPINAPRPMPIVPPTPMLRLPCGIGGQVLCYIECRRLGNTDGGCKYVSGTTFQLVCWCLVPRIAGIVGSF